MEAILSRIGQKNDRPLLKGTKEGIEKLWSERQECYAQADFTVDTSQKNIDEVVNEILTRLGRRINNEFSGASKN
jgi:shikimate kinase